MATPARRLASRCLSSRFPTQCYQRRTAMKSFFNRESSNAGTSESQEAPKPRPNPILDEYLRKNPTTPTTPNAQQAMQMPKPGDISASSIFKDDTLEGPEVPDSAAGEVEAGLPGRKTNVISRYTDPDPNARERWERKKVIQMVRRGGRLSHTQMLKRTEREHLAKSHMLKTSVKKLGMLARQIAGKTLDEAIVQMRFSKKKAAIEVRAQLEAARDEAIVTRGMGLGQVASPEEMGTAAAATTKQEPIDIQLKDGRRHTVVDRSQIYIDQAWVGRGKYGKLPEFRARGRVNLLRTPWTSISVKLKEEATRVREWQEREAKRKRQRTGVKVWTAMPDRPIQIQRQWYSW